MAAYTSSSMPLNFRQYTTLTKTDFPQGRVVDYTPSPRESVVEAVQQQQRARPKPWASSTPRTTVERKKRLEKMNLRGDVRRGSRSSATPITSSSCKRSDSTTNDSQRSALTSESLEERAAQCSNDLNNATKLRHPDASEDKEREELTGDQLEKRRNYEKCMSWIERLPAKFSGMHIAQERAPNMKD